MIRFRPAVDRTILAAQCCRLPEKEDPWKTDWVLELENGPAPVSLIMSDDEFRVFFAWAVGAREAK